MTYLTLGGHEFALPFTSAAPIPVAQRQGRDPMPGRPDVGTETPASGPLP